MSTNRQHTADVRGSFWGQDYPTVVAGIAGHGRGQASIPPREGCR